MAPVFSCPDDPLVAPLRRRSESSRDIQNDACFARRELLRASQCHRKRFQGIADRSVVHGVIEKNAAWKDPAANCPGNLLIDLIRGALNLPMESRSTNDR